ncbi:MAG: O-antigen ligase family protein, partial [Gammaproteobacteria bacterium]|nr:O-antigen ligase family protein [Gammaproteobacteria bacterium]
MVDNSQESQVSRFALYAVAMYLFVTLGRLHELFPFLMYLPIGKITVAVVLLAVLFMKPIKQSPSIKPPNKIVVLCIIYLLLAVLSVTVSVYKARSFELLTGPLLGTSILLYALVKTTRDIKSLSFYVKCFAFSGATLAYTTVTLGATGRLSVGMTFDPNDLAMVLVTILPLVVMLFIMARARTKLLYGGVVAIMLFAIVLTGSRGGFLGLVAVAGYLLLVRLPTQTKEKKPRLSFKKIVLILSAVAALAMFSSDEYWGRIATIFNPSDDYNVTSERGRLAIWGDGVELVLEYPYGVGIGAFSAAQGMISGGSYQTAHNTLIQVGAELGILGLFIFLQLYLRSIKILAEA